MGIAQNLSDRMGVSQNLPGKKCSEFNILNIYLFKSQQTQKIQDYFKNHSSEDKVKFNDNFEDLNDQLEDIQKNYRDHHQEVYKQANKVYYNAKNYFKEKLSIKYCYNIILDILDKDKNIEEEKSYISNCLEGKNQLIRPIVILGCKKEIIENKKKKINDNNGAGNNVKNKNEKEKRINETKILKKNNSYISNEYIQVAYYNDENYTNIIEKIEYLFRYYNNIGDIDTIINEILGQPEFKNFNKKKINFNATLNILVIGRIGEGKSTLINLLLNEKKARVGKELLGLSETKLFSRYIHRQHPITFIDTPGIENENDFLIMKDYLKETKKIFADGKYKIHAIFYVMNASNSRYFNYDEIELIRFIDQEMKIQIFFVCTRALNEINAKNYKEFIIVNLKQIFGIETPLANFVYCCQLLDEEDKIYKKFGISELLGRIHEFFKNDLEKIQKYLNSPNNGCNQHLDNKIFLSSLKDCNYNMKVCLNILCDNIIKYYANLIININKEKIIEMLINHLAYELNGDSSNKEIKNIIDSNKSQKEEINSSPNYFAINKLQENIVEKIGNSAKDIFFKSLVENNKNKNNASGTSFGNYSTPSRLRNDRKVDGVNIKNSNSKDNLQSQRYKSQNENEINKYLIDLINSYKSAIDSLKKLY